MKTFHLWLLDGKEITLKAENYEGLLCEIDSFFDTFKENVCYYSGCDDESIIEQAREEDIEFEVES